MAMAMRWRSRSRRLAVTASDRSVKARRIFVSRILKSAMMVLVAPETEAHARVEETSSNEANVEFAKGAIGNAAGAGSTIGLAYLGTRALQRRVDFAKKRYIASNDDDDERRDRRAEAKPQAEVLPTASNTFPSSALAGALGLGTYAIAEFTTRRISEWRQTLPDVRALRNLVTATSTLAEGLLYLLAFVFIISGVGIFMLGVQTVLRGADADADADRIDIANSDDNDNPMND